MASRGGDVFVVNLGGFELSERARAEIENEINKAVEKKLAAVDRVKGTTTKIPLGGEIRGLWLMKQLAVK